MFERNATEQRRVGSREAGRALFLFALLFAALLTGFTGCRAQQPWPLWEAYVRHFVDAQGRVIDRSAGDRTTSEGQAYAMFFALVDNDRPHFDALLRWTEANLAAGDLNERLPAWAWGHAPDGQWKILDANPASDADLWLAYDLIEAGRLWEDPRYDRLGRAVAARIAREEVVLIEGVGTVLAPGPHGFHPTPDTWYLNPSYTPLPVLTRLARLDPAGPWGAMLSALPAVERGDPGHGFALDWVLAGPGGVEAAAPPGDPASGQKQAQAAGSYDAIRVYLWLGLADAATPGRPEMLHALPGMEALLRTGAPPPRVAGESAPASARETGTALPAEPRGVASAAFSSAVAPYLDGLGLAAQAAAARDRTARALDPVTGLYGPEAAYYDQNLVLFSTAFSERRVRFDRDGTLWPKWK